ncbi:uncharacterized protein DFL_008393 [Arthrobotrys flagrans]|uniref:Uncharacterized protein n=1 Tax=Arthrobotrys flagrans TaxID=97331 RepID=A0A436ZNR4_ARTFL|nr:hypothetical protein DFL_008393 [Arthrobotrys flagrans]
MSEAFGIQLTFIPVDSPEKTLRATDMTAATIKSTPTRASSSSARDTSLCENFYKFDLQPKVSTTWSKGYKHPVQEWEFCPLQQGHSVHPSVAFTRNGRPRPTIEIPPHGKSLSLSMRASHRELGSRKSSAVQSYSCARAMSDSKARGSIVLSPGLWQRKRSATQPLNYDKNRPLPPLPLIIKKSEGEGLKPSLSFRRKRENMKRRQLQQQMELASIQTNIRPAPIKLPLKYTEEGSPKTEAITLGMGDAEVVTIGFEGYAPPVPAVPQHQFSNQSIRTFEDNQDDELSLFDFSFVPIASVEQVLGAAEEPISPFDLKGTIDESLDSDLPIKAKRFGCLPMKLRLEIPESTNSGTSPTVSCLQDDEAAEMDKMREQAGSRCIGREETVYNEDGVEERRYVYYPTQLSMDLQRSSSIIQQKRASVNRQPPYYTNFPPPHPEKNTREHQKKSSISSSRSQMTFSTLGGGHNTKYDQESQATDCEDYEADEDEDVNGNYTCASSFVSASSYPDSELSAGEEGCFTPVPQRLSAASRRANKSEKCSFRATTIETEATQVLPLPIPTPVGLDSSVPVFQSVTPKSSYDIITSAATPHVSFGLPPTPTEHKNPRKSASASHLPASGRSESTQSLNSAPRLSSHSCSNLKAVLDQSVPPVPPVPSVEINRAVSSEGTTFHNSGEGPGAQSLHSPGHKLLGHRSIIPIPSMFRNGDEGSNSKLRVIEEEPHQQRPSTAPAAPEYQNSRSFFEDYDDAEDVESGLSKVKRFLARCLSVKSRPLSAVHESEATSGKKAEKKKKAKKVEGVQEAVEKSKDEKQEERSATPPRTSSRFSRISRISKLGRGSGKWRWSYAMMGATFS